MAPLTLEVRRISIPLHTPFVTALRRATAVRSVVVRLRDEDGHCGFGEAPEVWRVTGESLDSIEACVLGPLAGVIASWHPDAPLDLLARRLSDAVVGNTGAKAACEIAATDLVARRAGVPLHRNLGASASVTQVATDVTVAADADPSTTTRHTDAGFRHLKIKVGVDPGDVARVRDIYDRAGGLVRIRIDANQGWTLEDAIAAIDAWSAAGVDIEFVEQPLPRRDLASHAALRRAVAVPIMLDESIFDVEDLNRAIDAESCDLVNIKLAKAGLWTGLEIARQARAAGLDVMVGSMLESQLGVAAAAAFAAAVDPRRVHDLDAAWWSLMPRHAVSAYEGNQFILSNGPGLSDYSSAIQDLGWPGSQ